MSTPQFCSPPMWRRLSLHAVLASAAADELDGIPLTQADLAFIAQVRAAGAHDDPNAIVLPASKEFALRLSLISPRASDVLPALSCLSPPRREAVWHLQVG